MNNENKLIIYHHSCSDGLGAAWAFSKRFPGCSFKSMKYNTRKPNVKGKDVFIVDFSFSRQIMKKIKEEANYVLLLDHHKTAMETIGDLPYCKFDMNHSGAMLAWNYCFPNEAPPWFMSYIEDKDLGRFALPNSVEINCFLQSFPLEIETLNFFQTLNPKDIINEGRSILRAQNNLVKQIINKAREVKIGGYKVLLANSPVLQSEVAGLLSIGRPFGAAWYENESGQKIFSLRSDDENGIDVAVIAEQYGGGGHKRASGFILSPNQEL